MWHSDEIWIQDSTKQLTVDFEEKLQQWYKSQVVLFLRWGYFVMDSKQYWFHLTAFTYSTEYKLLIILSPTVQKKNPSRVADKSIRSVYKMTVWCNILLTFCFFFFFFGPTLPLSRGVYDIEVSGNCVGQYNNKGSFGELALMYNTPRAATIVATEEGALWGLVRTQMKSWIVKSKTNEETLFKAL